MAGRRQPHRPVRRGKDELLREMDAAGVTGAVIVPPSWEGERNDLAPAAAARPDRFAVMGRSIQKRPVLAMPPADRIAAVTRGKAGA